MTSPNDEGIYLLDLTVHPGGLSTEFRYLSTHDYTTAPDDFPANTVYEGRLINAGELKRAMFENGGTVGRPAATQGYFEISNADGELDEWLDYGIGGWPFSLYYLASRDADYSTKTLVYSGTMRGFISDDLRTSIKIRIRDKIETLDRPFLTERFAGTTNSTGATAEGDSNMANQIKAYSRGWVYQADAQPANSYDLIYLASVNPQAVIFVYDGALLLTAAGPANYSSLSALQAATTGIAGSGANIEAGEYATCLSDSVTGKAYVRLAALPGKAITLEMRSSSTEADNSVGAVALAMLDDADVLSADIDDDSFDVLTNSSTNWRCGIYINDEKTVLDAVCAILNSVSATLVGTADNKIKAVSLGTVPDSLFFTSGFADQTPVDTFTNEDLSRDTQFALRQSPEAEGDGVLAWALYFNFRKNWKVLSEGDMNAAASAATRNVFTSEWPLKLSSGNSAVLTKNPLAQLLTFDGLLTTGTGGQIQASRRFDFYGKRRDHLTFSVSAERAGTLDLGDIITVKPTNAAGNPRYGYGADGKLGCIIGRHDQFSNRRVTFTVFVAVG